MTGIFYLCSETEPRVEGLEGHISQVEGHTYLRILGLGTLAAARNAAPVAEKYGGIFYLGVRRMLVAAGEVQQVADYCENREV